jgi:hypothetical protein
MRLQKCVGSVCGGGTVMMCHGRDVHGVHTVGFGNSTCLLLHVVCRWRSVSLRDLIREQR